MPTSAFRQMSGLHSERVWSCPTGSRPGGRQVSQFEYAWRSVLEPEPRLGVRGWDSSSKEGWIWPGWGWGSYVTCKGPASSWVMVTSGRPRTDKETDTHDWRLYLPATSLASGNNEVTKIVRNVTSMIIQINLCLNRYSQRFAKTVVSLFSIKYFYMIWNSSHPLVLLQAVVQECNLQGRDKIMSMNRT